MGLAADRKKGTFVTDSDSSKESSMYEQQEVWGVNSLHPVEHFRIKAASTLEAVQILQNFCSEKSLPLPKILASTYEDGHLRLMVSGDPETLQALVNSLSPTKTVENLNLRSAAVSITGSGLGQPGVIESALALLQKTQIPVHKVLTSPRTLSFVVDLKHYEKAVTTLHSLIKE
ncbi:MAG: ACT domain-containing protein [Bdellovibrionales bacterium]|nr:ACT domain-containing protein [Bdellovibrionales bacterium]